MKVPAHFHATLAVVLALLLPCAVNTFAQGTGDNAIRLIVEQMRQAPEARIRGARLLQTAAVAKFLEARGFTPVWKIPGDASNLLKAIRAIEEDGLTPDDYHLATLTAALDAHAKAATPQLADELLEIFGQAIVVTHDDPPPTDVAIVHRRVERAS